jgi:hypothetical protein
MSIDGGDILNKVVAAVVLAALGWLWLFFTKGGQALWASLGKVEGLRSVAVVAAGALLLAIVAVVVPFAVRFEPATVVMVPHRIGPTGEQTPEQIAKQGGTETYFSGPLNNLVVPASSDRVCMVSRVEIHTQGICTLVHRGGHQPWEISVAESNTHCQVTCFDLTVSR